jgi:hypothetical protein
MTSFAVLVSGEPVISFVWDSLVEGRASSNNMVVLEDSEQVRARQHLLLICT